MIRRYGGLLALLALVGLALETTLFASASLAGAKPQLLLLMVVALAVAEGPAVGGTAGFVAGLSIDLVAAAPAGLTALVYTVIGYAIGSLRAQLQAPTAWLPMGIVFAAAFVGVVLYAASLSLLGLEAVGPVELLRLAALSALYTALLTPFVYPPVRALAGRLRPRKVYR